MKFSLIFFELVLLATSTVAAPQSRRSGLARRMERRANGLRAFQGSTMASREHSKSRAKEANVHSSSSTNSSDIEYSSNWSGAVLLSPPTGETFNAVSGVFTVPTPSIPSGVDATDGEYAASAWVGIDGDTYSTAILQTGVDFTVDTSGSVSFQAWYEWYPDVAYNFDITISAGDVINASVVAYTTTTGIAIIENLTTGKTVSMDLTSTSALGGENAEWIVEDFEEGSSLVAFANFANVTFTDCIASTSESSEGVSSATIMDIENDSDEVLTDVTIISDSSFMVSYIGSTSTSSASSSSSTGTNTGNGGSGSTKSDKSGGSGKSNGTGKGGKNGVQG